ncbi:MAG: cytochrome c oxidase subunit II [Thermomicrobium sp.]|nr:cytochrome c oxidase subunit II [Thermomicrobium sp.]
MRWRLAWIFPLGGLLFTSGCGVIGGKIASTSDPAGDQARHIWNLFVVPVWWLTVAVFLLVTVWMLLNIIRFRRKPGDTRIPPQVHGNTRLEIAWTLIPAIILALIAIPSTRLIFELNRDPGQESNALRVEVIGHQWWWEFRYPEYGIVTAGDLHVVVDRPVVLTITSQDVIHSFWPPRLAGKVDAIPGRHNTMVFTPEETGVFYGQCAELCGAQHAHMQFRVVVETQEDFDAWVAKHQRPVPQPAAGTLAAQGKELFEGSAGCAGCHSVDPRYDPTTTPINKTLMIGPNLAYFPERHTLAAFLPNTPENLHQWIANTEQVKPYSTMAEKWWKIRAQQNMLLTDDQVNAIVAYLESLR